MKIKLTSLEIFSKFLTAGGLYILQSSVKNRSTGIIIEVDDIDAPHLKKPGQPTGSTYPPKMKHITPQRFLREIWMDKEVH